jgi:glutathione S-transferase
MRWCHGPHPPHTLSGSPYVWPVQIALAHKGLPYALRTLSYDAGDFVDAVSPP